jgi:hypothetical protein
MKLCMQRMQTGSSPPMSLFTANIGRPSAPHSEHFMPVSTPVVHLCQRDFWISLDIATATSYLSRSWKRTMGKIRTCDKRCHDAKKPECDCWCGGKFHGARGEAARQEFRDRYGREIEHLHPEETGPQMRLFW